MGVKEQGEGDRRGSWGKGTAGGGGMGEAYLDILCFDGLALIFTAVFLCCDRAVLKSSISS